MSEMMLQARLDYHIIILTKLVKGAVRPQADMSFVCDTCNGVDSEISKVPHPDNCPVGDLQRLIDGAEAPGASERNYRLANEGLHQVLDNIHELVKNPPGLDLLNTCVLIINQVHGITKALVEDLKRRKTDEG